MGPSYIDDIVKEGARLVQGVLRTERAGSGLAQLRSGDAGIVAASSEMSISGGTSLD